MSAYLLVPLLACLGCAVTATAIFIRAAEQRVSRVAGWLVSCAGVWAFFELLWNVQREPEAALSLMRASALGWAWMAPQVLQLFVELSDRPQPRARRALPWFYAAAGAFVLVDCLTPWVHRGVVRTSWGWGYEFGPAYPAFYAFMLGSIVWALAIGRDTWRGAQSPGEREQAGWLSLGVLVPLLVASLTDGVLPLAGVQVPRFGTASFGVLGALILWSFHRRGYSLLAPGTFADEILETLPDGVAMLHLDGRVRSGNGALAALLGVERRELVGLRITDRLSQPIHPTDDALEQHCKLQDVRGSWAPVAICSRVLRDRQEAPIGLVLVVRDLDEVVALRDRLLLSDRLAAVGELAAGIAHEINNPLAFVRSNLARLREQWGSVASEVQKAGPGAAVPLLDEGQEILDESLDGVDRATAIVRDVRGLAHGGRRERCAANLNELLEGVLRIAAPQLRRVARVVTEFGEIPPVHGAPQELQQVFLNLVLNAAHAVGELGTIRVSTTAVEGSVMVSVEDDGCGIDPDILDRIFDPFFTTKGVGEGTGLGLGIAYGIVRHHGGYIAVESEPGRGARFSVRLPAALDTLGA